MPDIRKVLLARPHFAIVELMQNILKRNNFTPFSIEKLDEITTIGQAGLKGVIISTSVVSKVDESFAETFLAVRTQFPNIPVLFTTQVKVKQMGPQVENVLKSIVPGTRVLGFSTDLLSNPSLGSKEVIILISKGDMEDSEKTQSVDNLLKFLFK